MQQRVAPARAAMPGPHAFRRLAGHWVDATDGGVDDSFDAGHDGEVIHGVILFD